MRHPDVTALRRLDFIPFPEDLVQVKREFLAWARQQGLDPGEVVFDFLTPAQITEVASYDGFPGRYPHWRFGMSYDQQQKSHAWGLSTIYEMVINNRPAFAYLLEGSTPVVQRMVIAHVLGHTDFFRNNAYFASTNKNMLNDMANHSSRVRRQANRHGFEKVERFLDTCLSLENLTDPNFLFRRARQEKAQQELERLEKQDGPRFTSPYLSSYVRTAKTPSQPLPEKHAEDQIQPLKPFPEKPARGVLDFLVEHAPLEDWERDLLDIVRDEAYYFLPQRLTKIMNEGWAVFWHTRIMVAKGLGPGDMVPYADEHSKIVAPWSGRLNPYRLGWHLFEDIKDRWDRGRHGPDWEACQDLHKRERWDTREGKGMEKVFEVRAAFNDAQFVDNFLTPEFALKSRLFTFKLRPRENAYVLESREFEKVRQALLAHLTNGGEPILQIEDANHKNRAELFLRHVHPGVDLKVQEARQTLHALYGVWRRPVNLETLFQGQRKVYTYDGQRDGEA